VGDGRFFQGQLETARGGSGNSDSMVSGSLASATSLRGGDQKREAMKRTRWNHSTSRKAQVALATIKGNKTLAEMAEQLRVHSTQITE
jgi:hypothetical protein